MTWYKQYPIPKGLNEEIQNLMIKEMKRYSLEKLLLKVLILEVVALVVATFINIFLGVEVVFFWFLAISGVTFFLYITTHLKTYRYKGLKVTKRGVLNYAGEDEDNDVSWAKK
ncbi:MAG: hypothetical protein ACH0QD_13260 [Tepidibacillus sp.]